MFLYGGLLGSLDALVFVCEFLRVVFRDNNNMSGMENKRYVGVGGSKVSSGVRA